MRKQPSRCTVTIIRCPRGCCLKIELFNDKGNALTVDEVFCGMDALADKLESSGIPYRPNKKDAYYPCQYGADKNHH
jgi:hypothetical protein